MFTANSLDSSRAYNSLKNKKRNFNDTLFKINILQCTQRKPHRPQQVLYPGRIRIWRCWFLWREGNRSTWRNTLETRREPTINSTHIWHRAGVEPRPHRRKASALSAAPSPLSQVISRHSWCSTTSFPGSLIFPGNEVGCSTNKYLQTKVRPH